MGELLYTLLSINWDDGGFHKWVVLQNGWFIMENPMNVDDN